MCIEIVEICFGIAHWQISSVFDRVIRPQHDSGGVYFVSRFILFFFYNRPLIRREAKTFERVASLEHISIPFNA